MKTFMNFKSMVAVVGIVLCGFAFNTQAAVLTLGEPAVQLDTDNTFGNYVKALEVNVTDIYSFTLAQNSNLDVVMTSTDVPGFIGFPTGAAPVVVFDGGGFTEQSIPFGQIVSFANVIAGSTITLKIVSSTGTTGYGGAYSGVIRVNAVPLPSAVWLFGSALFGLTVVGRNRRMKSGTSLPA